MNSIWFVSALNSSYCRRSIDDASKNDPFMRVTSWRRQLENLFWRWITLLPWSFVWLWWHNRRCRSSNVRFMALLPFWLVWASAGWSKPSCRLRKITWIRIMADFADILIWVGAFGVLFGTARQYFRSRKKRTPPACLPMGFWLYQ